MKLNTHGNKEHPVMDAVVSPKNLLNTLTKKEVNRLLNTSQGDLHEIFRKCALAVLNCGSYVEVM